jgi:NAD+ synthase (glutamine-hydrolysing)
VALALFPELSLTGYALDDLLGQDAVLDAVRSGLATIVQTSTGLLPVLIVEAPLRHQNRPSNTAVVIHRGRVLGVVKQHLRNYREFL